ncbi:MAG: hypothetical protein LKJ99_06790 [Acidaminococcaceae bacterium]|jgi:hypothetical protein|nr:hypothetical protein [Acidaminococcaceae bacterium]MCI2110659.1 hypothetical protein [Acidaminococcaceae bacterium]
MDSLSEKFKRLGIDNAAGQEERQQTAGLDLRGDPLPGPAVNFSHGDVDAHEPTPGALDVFVEGYKKGGCVAYTVYRGSGDIRKEVAGKLAAFTGVKVKHFFQHFGKEFFQQFGKQIFPLFGKQFFQSLGKEFFLLLGKHFFHNSQSNISGCFNR